MEPGFLVPEEDFFYIHEKRAVYYYINTLPRWKSFYEYNWKYVECLIRNYAMKNKVELLVYSGMFGKTKFYNRIKGEYVDISLYNVNKTRAFPIPIILWKAVYDRKGGAGIALIGVNTAFRSKRRYDVCPDITDQLPWFIYQDRRSPEYIYACTIEDLRINVPHIPTLNSSKILNLDVTWTEKPYDHSLYSDS